MSFTTTIKEEISRIPNTRSESIAELSAIVINSEIKNNTIKIDTNTINNFKNYNSLDYDFTTDIFRSNNSNGET